MIKYFEFERQIEKVETTLDQLKKNQELNVDKIKKLNIEKEELYKKIYSNLDPWQKVQVSRHGERPHTLDYIENIFTDIVFLHGDKKYADDNAIVGGLAKISDISIFFIGTEKGNSMETRIKHNFGMAKPEGYRKVQRLIKLAEKFKLPLISFVDTAGAFPGKDAEERGQSESIASSIMHFIKAKIPTISIIIGEGGSGGAIGIATSDRVLMLEHSIYSVISPEGCASILWRNTKFSQEAAKTLKLTSNDCKNFKIIDDVIPEPYGGAHRHPLKQSEILKNKIINLISELKTISIKELVALRKEKYLNITSDI
ncbi:acetyl-CoA carboxylase carboxyltransferase subunit alpha [Pelagibacteraceae bacterium]|nr:acetyl-CoA carboxylase carboxyltransferase subunit alpha [Pelagibacteraceae bacterium]